MKEVFKDIPNYEGLYQVSNLGNVKSLNYRRTKKEDILSLRVNQSGYYIVSLYKNGESKQMTAHQLVAVVFLNHKPSGYKLVINHINFNKLDNRVENLEVVTARENCNKKHFKSTSKYVGVSWDKTRDKWKVYIVIDGKNRYLGRFTNEYDAHLAYQKKLKEHEDNSN